MAADRMPLECLPLKLPELLRHTLDLLQSSAVEKGAALSLSVADNLPPTLYGDPLRLRQVRQQRLFFGGDGALDLICVHCFSVLVMQIVINLVSVRCI